MDNNLQKPLKAVWPIILGVTGRAGEITKEEQYTYPEMEARRTKAALDTLREEKTE